MTDEIVRLSTQGPVAVLTMDRPPVNALNDAMYLALSRELDRLETRSDVRVVILTAGRGLRVFSAGADIKDFERLFDHGESYRFCRLAHEVNNRFERLPQITIAAIDGAALGGGAELVLAFDLRVSSQVSRIGFPEITVGQAPLTGGTLRLPWLIGESAARAILLSGEPISADRAYQLGLFHMVVPSGQAFPAALEWGQRLARHPAQAVLGIKLSLSLNRDRDVGSGTDRDTILSQWIFEGADAREGHNAFVESREAQFAHHIPPLPDGLDRAR
jgi:enoyl-CoA hydratase